MKENPAPSLEQLTEVFKHYVTGQTPRAKTVVDLSGSITRYEAQDNSALKFAARHVVPWVSDRIKAKLYASFSRGGPWLEYLPLPARDSDLRKASKKSSPSITTKLIAGTIMLGYCCFLADVSSASCLRLGQLPFTVHYHFIYIFSHLQIVSAILFLDILSPATFIANDAHCISPTIYLAESSGWKMSTM